MGRNPMIGARFVPDSTNMMEDSPITDIQEAQGNDGVAVYLHLRLAALGVGYGYYLPFAVKAARRWAVKAACTPGCVRETVAFCLQAGVFDKTLFERYGVLTSEDIQKTFIETLAGRRAPVLVIDEYWLLTRDFAEAKKAEERPRAIFVARDEYLHSAYRDLLDAKERLQKQMKLEELGKEGETNAPIIPHQNGELEKERRQELVTRVIARLQSLIGVNFQADKEGRLLMYRLLDIGYDERDMIAAVHLACDAWQAAPEDTPHPNLLNLFSVRDFEELITGGQAAALENTNYKRTHYSPLPRGTWGKGGRK